MKRVILAIGFLSIGFSTMSCGNSSGTTTPSGNGTTLAGTVTDVVSAAPISGVTVALQSKSTTTGADGKYSFTGITAGSASITAQHQGHVNFTQPVTLNGAGTLNIPLTPSLAVTGAGNWSGSWRNTTFGTTGTMTMRVTVDTVAQTMQLPPDVNGNVSGGADTPAEIVPGSYP